MTDDAHLDGCALDFTENPTADGDGLLGLVLFADIADDLEAVEARRVELIEWAAATDA